MKYWETRKKYSNFKQLELDLLNRTGRSILHEIDDDELIDLVSYIKHEVGHTQEIIEKDRWTISIAEKQ